MISRLLHYLPLVGGICFLFFLYASFAWADGNEFVILVIKITAISCVIGLIAAPAGISGGILFLPMASLLLPLHIDVIRGTSIIMSLAMISTSIPKVSSRDLVSLPAAITVSLFTVTAAMIGAVMGLSIDRDILDIALGSTVITVALLMLFFNKKKTRVRESERPLQSSPLAMALFSMAGFLSGMLGLGTGWANTPILNIVLRFPLDRAAATSLMIIAATVSGSAMIYLAAGTVEPLLVMPAVAGMYTGTRLSLILMNDINQKVLSYLVIAVLITAGILTICK